jgi:hypothetical protein
MVGMITPINATVIHVVLCLAGSLMFTAGLGSAARVVLCKTSLV